VRTPGAPLRRLNGNNPPISPYLESVRITTHDLGYAHSVLFCTDGLNEAETADGSLYREHLGPHFEASPGRDLPPPPGLLHGTGTK